MTWLRSPSTAGSCLVTDTVLRVIRGFAVDVSQLHNDSTTVTVTGTYATADRYRRGGKPTPALRRGHNQDFRPDLKQLLWILTISADVAVPIAYRSADGNTVDGVTHIPTWDELVRLVGRADFLYVADSKLCSAEAMGHVHARGGRFVTVIPHGRREDTWFRDWAQTHAPEWTEADRRPGARLGDPDQVWRTFVAPAPSAEGHRVIWVHSSAKAARDTSARAARIEKGLAAIDAVAARLASPKSRLRTKVAAEQAATAALAEAGAARWVGFEITGTATETYRQERRGQPGSTTRFRRSVKTVFTIAAAVKAGQIAYDAATDGCFPLISNADQHTPAEVLAAYQYQPNLERRNHMLKGPQEVAPVFLETPHRIEALLLCHFLAMLTEVLIERDIRTSMKAAGLTGILLYPELRDCPARAPPASSKSSTTSNATTSSAARTSCKSSSPSSPHYNGKSSDSCTSQQRSTPQPAPPEMGAHISRQKCGTSDQCSAPNSLTRDDARLAALRDERC